MSAHLEADHAEAMVVGGAAQDASCLLAVDLDAGDFRNPAAQRLWSAMRVLAAAGGWRNPDDLLVQVARNEQELTNLRDYLEGAALTAAPRDVPAYSLRVKHHATTRQALAVVAKAPELADQGLEGEDLVVRLQAELNNLRGRAPRQHSRTAQELAESLADLVLAPDDIEGATRYVPIGIRRLDEAIGGFQGGVVSVLAARTSHGKSAFMLQCAIHAAEKGIPVHLLSCEDLESDTGWRLLSRATGIPARDLRRYRALSDAQRECVAKARGGLDVLSRIRITPASGLSAEQVVAHVRLHQRADETGLVLFDYLQRIPVGKAKRYEAFSDAMLTFDHAAKTDGLPWVIASQLKRSESAKPRLEDLREAGTIEEIAKTVIGLYRPGKGGDDDDRMWIGVLKASNDELVEGQFGWDGPRMRVLDGGPR